MNKYIIWTTDNASWIAPCDKAKLPKSFSNSYEIETQVQICNKKIKLPQKILKIEDVSGLISRLTYELKQDEIEAVKQDLNL